MYINSELLNKRVVTECYHVAVAVSEQNCISIQQGFVAGAQTFALKRGTESGAQLTRGSNGVLFITLVIENLIHVWYHCQPCKTYLLRH